MERKMMSGFIHAVSKEFSIKELRQTKKLSKILAKYLGISELDSMKIAKGALTAKVLKEDYLPDWAFGLIEDQK